MLPKNGGYKNACPICCSSGIITIEISALAPNLKFHVQMNRSSTPTLVPAISVMVTCFLRSTSLISPTSNFRQTTPTINYGVAPPTLHSFHHISPWSHQQRSNLSSENSPHSNVILLQTSASRSPKPTFSPSAAGSVVRRVHLMPGATSA